MPKIQITEDGSHTLFSEMAGQTYHSSHGAIQESNHIFISQLSTLNSQLSVLEIGFGTGLNALLTAKWANEHKVKIEYTTIELYPLESVIYRELNYGRLLGDEELFLRLHEVAWNAGFVQVSEYFAIRKCKSDIVEWLRNAQCTMHNAQSSDQSDFSINSQLSTFNFQYDVVYFDAFSPDAQPELWSEEVFLNIYQLMKEGSVLTTYCAKGDVRRAMLTAGFKVEKLQGPPGKRHILRAVKI
ncbi:MAG: tRNA (5-methylaminomethyl-2-thiouridine)(34)-methyltransferase MnmD [Paludibacteraceae bacterium]|nr:tRNA (5-methylaminomethyl-2-thiouridine)(34)-methyltransferase MnmD [Paludibacteraceae bacterium]